MKNGVDHETHERHKKQTVRNRLSCVLCVSWFGNGAVSADRHEIVRRPTAGRIRLTEGATDFAWPNWPVDRRVREERTWEEAHAKAQRREEEDIRPLADDSGPDAYKRGLPEIVVGGVGLADVESLEHAAVVDGVNLVGHVAILPRSSEGEQTRGGGEAVGGGAARVVVAGLCGAGYGFISSGWRVSAK